MNKRLITKEAEDFTRDKLSGESSGHDWWHIVRVRNIAQKLCEIEGGDSWVVDIALLLHDVGDRKVIKQDDDDYTIAEDFLRRQGFDDNIRQQIMTIIMNMSFSKSLGSDTSTPRSIEFQIVQDADRLDALGAIGIARAFAYGGSRERPLYDPSYSAKNFLSRDDYIKAQGSSLHHFDEKLLHLKDLLNTSAAKRIALERDDYMREFQQRFLDEWSGKK